MGSVSESEKSKELKTKAVESFHVKRSKVCTKLICSYVSAQNSLTSQIGVGPHTDFPKIGTNDKDDGTYN